MTIIHCDICGEASARYEDGAIVVYSPHSPTHAAEIALETVLEAVRCGEGEGVKILQDFIHGSNCLFG